MFMVEEEDNLNKYFLNQLKIDLNLDYSKQISKK